VYEYKYCTSCPVSSTASSDSRVLRTLSRISSILNSQHDGRYIIIISLTCAVCSVQCVTELDHVVLTADINANEQDSFKSKLVLQVLVLLHKYKYCVLVPWMDPTDQASCPIVGKLGRKAPESTLGRHL
jgi:hypothetical protein